MKRKCRRENGSGQEVTGLCFFIFGSCENFKLRLQERLVLSALSFSLSLIHSVVKRGGTEVEERGLEGLRRRGKKKQECIFLIHFLHRLEVSVV